MTADDTMYRYWLARPGQPEREVTGTEWRAAERAAGFSAPEGRNATAGFGGLNGVSGRITLRGTDEPGMPPAPDQDQEPWDDENGTVRYRKMTAAHDKAVRLLRYRLARSVWNMNHRPGTEQEKDEGRAYGYAKSLEIILDILGSPDYAGYPDWTVQENGRLLPDGAVAEARDYLGARADTMLGKKL